MRSERQRLAMQRERGAVVEFTAQRLVMQRERGAVVEFTAQRLVMQRERGAVVEFTALSVALVSLLAVVFHFLVVGHVRHVVELHVDAGVLDTAAFDGSEADGIARVNTGLENATGWLEDYEVSASRTPDVSTVRVEAQALEVLPWLNSTVVVERTLITESTNP